MTQQTPDQQLHDLIGELNRAHDRLKYYNEMPSKPELLEKLNYWHTEAHAVWNRMDAYDGDKSDLEDEIDELSQERRSLRNKVDDLEDKIEKLESEFDALAGEKRKVIDKLTHDLEAECNDSLLLQSAIIAVLGKEKLDMVLAYAKAADAELSKTTGRVV